MKNKKEGVSKSMTHPLFISSFHFSFVICHLSFVISHFSLYRFSILDRKVDYPKRAGNSNP